MRGRRETEDGTKCKDEEYTFSPVLQSGKKVQINYTDMTKIGDSLDTTKDVPLKKP